MATRKTSARKTAPENTKSTAQKVSAVNVVKLKDVIGKFLVLQKINSLLTTIFYLIWIPVGLFFLWFIIANFRLGAFDQLLQGPNAANQQPAAPEAPAAPTETNVPGVGSVNVNCVQQNLSEDAIIKIVQDQGTQNLSEEERAKLQPCIVEAASPSPESSPQQ